MGSPFRQTEKDEAEMLQDLIDRMGQRFLTLVARHRKLEQKAMAEVATARIFIGEEALRLGLVDKIGYVGEAIAQAKKAAGLHDDSKVIAYRRTEYPEDNIYNPAATQARGGGLNLFHVAVPDYLLPPSSGLYYLWLPGGGGQ
jgi:protease-4